MYEEVDIDWDEDNKRLGDSETSGVASSRAFRMPTTTTGGGLLFHPIGNYANQQVQTGSSIGQPTLMSCVTASTGINSLSVALGSTFGAFLALGVIVAFVLAAKWQHVHRTRKLLP